MGVLAVSHWGGNVLCPKNQRLGGTAMSEEGEGLNTSIWTRTAGHSPCTQCFLLEGATVRIFPKPGVRGVGWGVYSLANFKLD